MKVNNPVEVYNQKQRDKAMEFWKLDPNKSGYVKHIWNGVPLSTVREIIKDFTL